ncbi:CoA transferase [Stakelama sp. CBK3Z-3]|uniref:CoA transferase n=1 Tax=Stakelama flava TaxID=2860338 RepID=A0ABS6XQ37_9SPHN|nr:CoA transferase [Stakelama flava]MBW4332322.1 CoA transferase [Stakelama flava]
MEDPKARDFDSASRSQNRLLEGVRILDLTTVIMGPYATHILADLGADVIKIEPPAGDSARQHPPHGAPGLPGIFMNLNRNKRSVVLDLKTPEGRHALDRLIATCDVLVHNLRAHVMERLGFDYQHCSSIKPDIIYCAAYGFGAAGPYGSLPAYDDLIQAASGFSALSTPITGSPSYAPAVIFDKISGQAIANAILAALFDRARTGLGQDIEVPMFETAIEFNLMEAFAGAAFVPPKGKPGYTRIQIPERRPFRTADGYACIMPYSDANWQDFFTFAGRSELIGDPRYMRLEDRSSQFSFLYGLIEQTAPLHSTEEWRVFCGVHNIPFMPMIDLENIFDDPHVREVGLFETVEHPHAGAYRAIQRPTRYGSADFELKRHAPLLGEHTEEVLADLDQRAGASREPVADLPDPRPHTRTGHGV